MRNSQAIPAFILAVMLLTGCSSQKVYRPTSESSPGTAAQTVQDTRMNVCAETESILATALDVAEAWESLQELVETNSGAETEAANHLEEVTSQPTDATQPSHEAPSQPTTQTNLTSPPEPTAPPETVAPTQPPSEKPAALPAVTEHMHSWTGWTQTKVPTCKVAGEETRSCYSCGAKETRPVAATGRHTWSEVPPSCTEDGEKICSVCGASETVSAPGHSWVHHEEEGHWETVIICYCGERFQTTEEWDAHASANPDLEYLDAHAGYYAYEEWEISSTAYDICSRCGEVKNP